MDKVAWLIAAVVYIAILFALVRPKSKGAGLVEILGATLADLVRGVAGQTFDKQTNKWSPAQ
jgi:hypothetical protein